MRIRSLCVSICISIINTRIPKPCVFLRFMLACTTDKTKLWLGPSAKQRWNPCSGPPPVYQDLSKRHDWPVKKATVHLPIRMKGSSRCTSVNSLGPLGAENNDLGTASQTLLTKVKLRLQRRLAYAYAHAKAILTNAEASYTRANAYAYFIPSLVLMLVLLSLVRTRLKCFGAIPIQSHIRLNFSTAFYETLTSKHI